MAVLGCPKRVEGETMKPRSTLRGMLPESLAAYVRGGAAPDEGEH